MLLEYGIYVVRTFFGNIQQRTFVDSPQTPLNIRKNIMKNIEEMSWECYTINIPGECYPNDFYI